MKLVLKVSNISKFFKEYKSEWYRIASWFGFNFKPIEVHHILKKIDFTIAPGESVGIVGQNGAGKSTLLKIITGTLKPSGGTVEVNGRISAILELGMGFNSDLTGRQNVYHSAGLMGYSVEQIDKVIADIESFTEIGEYFDQPVRTYSSGMQMRVAFGVATMYRPEILIVDEALSVGDTYFQHKSFERIREFQKQGTTLLIVSHDKGAIQAICNRAILLEKGVVIKDGDPEAIMDFYNALIAQKENSTIKQVVREDGKTETISGTGEVSIENAQLCNAHNEPVEYINVGEDVTLKVDISVHKDIPQLVLGYLIKDRLGQEVFGINTHHLEHTLNNVPQGEKIEFNFAFPMNVGVGSYAISLAAHAQDTHLETNYEWKDQALLFNVINIDKKEFVGLSWIEPKIEVHYVN
ncbi:ABC transporter ATP-binding protein [Sulfurovum sp. NBC37-1]|uniref:ABC transporter ATP-binding protein n=1 Tax=Sulfurovum sp. (strain NBC37-1) TaxID=387093 RepID=UPI00015876C1|nr:ABC transporter ATP-binding protein [Sulfurovum sp. NBC37-1]BAF71286.1 ABC transporter, ATP-binding protein [Sulfurovum sp. NBC37-1]